MALEESGISRNKYDFPNMHLPAPNGEGNPCLVNVLPVAGKVVHDQETDQQVSERTTVPHRLWTYITGRLSTEATCGS
jgi:hypothetical protein